MNVNSAATIFKQATEEKRPDTFNSFLGAKNAPAVYRFIQTYIRQKLAVSIGIDLHSR